MRAVLLAVFALMAANPASAQGVPEGPTTGVAVVLAARLNLRIAPSLDGAVVGAVHRGDSVCVAGREEDWLRIRKRDTNSPDGVTTDSFEASTAAEDVFAARGFLSEIRLGPEELRKIGC